MIHEEPHGTQHIVASFVMAMAVTIIPVPESIAIYKPEWVALVLLYWVMALPHRIGVNTGWVLGLCLDVLKGALLGQHALALALLAYIMQSLSLRIRMYPFWQQSVVIALILLIYHALLLWIYDMTGTIEISWHYWWPVLLGALLWPWIVIVLRDIRRRYHVR